MFACAIEEYHIQLADQPTVIKLLGFQLANILLNLKNPQNFNPNKLNWLFLATLFCGIHNGRYLDVQLISYPEYPRTEELLNIVSADAPN